MKRQIVLIKKDLPEHTYNLLCEILDHNESLNNIANKLDVKL